MKSRLRKIVPAGAMLAAIISVGAGNAQAATTCNVPADRTTIQIAVADASCDIVEVSPGGYAGDVLISRSVILRGAQAGNPVGERTFADAAESTLTGQITIAAADVTIDGLSITKSVLAFAAFGIVVKTAGDDASITNNIIDTVTSADTGSNGTAQGIYLENGPDRGKILGNAFANIQSDRSAKAVLIGDSAASNAAEDVLIEGNSVDGITSTTRGAYGFSVGNLAGVPNLQIRNNTINNLTGGGWAHAIGLERDTPGAIIRDNSISNVVDQTPSPVNDAIGVFFEANPSYFTGSVNKDNFDAVPVGIAVHPSLSGPEVDGTCDWWGAPSGPSGAGTGTGAAVSANVDFSPWLLSPAPYGSCGGGLLKKDCKDAVHDNRKAFDQQQKADKKAFDQQQKADKQAFDATSHTKEEKKAFDDQQKADNKAFDQQQKADEQAFDAQNKSDAKLCQ